MIFVSIDDNEVFHLGAVNGASIWRSKQRCNVYLAEALLALKIGGSIGDAHEYLLIYAINHDLFKARKEQASVEMKSSLRFTKIQMKTRKGYGERMALSAQGYRPNQMYEIDNPVRQTTSPTCKAHAGKSLNLNIGSYWPKTEFGLEKKAMLYPRQKSNTSRTSMALCRGLGGHTRKLGTRTRRAKKSRTSSGTANCFRNTKTCSVD
ncbi:MAG: hypothetical protein V9G23_06950 [Giesbergeria sp.]